MPRGKFSTINVPTELKDNLKKTAMETGNQLLMTDLSIAQLINMMHETWKSTLLAKRDKK